VNHLAWGGLSVAQPESAKAASRLPRGFRDKVFMIFQQLPMEAWHLIMIAQRLNSTDVIDAGTRS
jgi:hypothetical protein